MQTNDKNNNLDKKAKAAAKWGIRHQEMLPLVLFIAGYLIGMQWQLGGLIGALAFALSIALIIAYDRLVMKKKNTVYTIVGFAPKGHHPQK